VLDQLTKYFAAGKQAALISNFLYITSVENTGIGFGLLKGSNPIVIFLTIIFIGAVLYYYDRIPKNKYVVVLAALLLGGALGNLADRIFLGFVRDFINFTFWPAFNIADASITIGGIGLIAYFLKKK
jgi:signal peptidase II